MTASRYRWSNRQLREQADIIDGKKAPNLLLKQATYLNSYVDEWLVANIWIHDDRIVYVGEKLPADMTDCEVIDCEGKFLVPGYIEPHVHPFQLYNPETLAQYAGRLGTTTFINDNMNLIFELSLEVAFEFINEFEDTPYTMYWWCRFDGQTELKDNENVFNTERIHKWLRHEAVVQGGELTGWTRLLNGDEEMLSWLQEAKKLRKKVEGHLPGASEQTLAKFMLFGIDCDHEAMTGEEVLRRLMQGYTVSLRYSSIRPDLPTLLKEMLELGVKNFDRMFFTSDGSHPFFYEDGFTDLLIRMAIDSGVPLIDAYKMASYNIARFYNFEHLHGSIATGRIANINILNSKNNPTPIGVLGKGKWLLRDGQPIDQPSAIAWKKYQFTPLSLQWDLTAEDFEFPTSLGMEFVNNVIAKQYVSEQTLESDELSNEHGECFAIKLARDGSWRVNTMLKGFATDVDGFASSYTGTGDIVLIGKKKADMRIAFERMKALGGGIVLVENGEVIHEVPLRLLGANSDLPLEALIQEEKKMTALLKERGYRYEDPAYTLMFLSSTHLPFTRLTQIGLYDVKERKVLVEPVKRG